MKEFDKALNKYGKYVIQQSRSNLTREDKAGGNLYNNLSYNIEDNHVVFTGEYYGKFVDEGVRGKTSYYSKSANSPFRFGTGTGKKGGLTRGISSWIKRKGIRGRVQKGWKGSKGKGGRFISHKSLTFLIARSVYNHGLRATHFFSKPFERGVNKYGDEMIEGYFNDNIKTFK